MSGFEVIKLLHYGKCNDVFVSRDAQGNLVAVKRFYKLELENRSDYTNRGGKIVKRDWTQAFKESIDVQRMIECDFCIKLLDVVGDFDAQGGDVEMGALWLQTGA
ncbi:serine/threonine protein kinase, putative [Theileria equi strain WA]|uniref:Serine/threonine protein kinase, putative n=1 Tax=Theileria equi strain WA TaxID=1537102 RepID=L0AWG0_THEEQ|nr:serine/threonine protein kinase, putative [Theileria equi strain WA]AFZ79588.1 serine/threonine protein kinase, putative [Theileria equi strain WA]|eukprot:XP_004829254.1 serine/threonine protein kinase, putative [Theileria equi strain WA]